MLDENRISQMAEGLRQIAALPDPIGEGNYSTIRPNGLEIRRVQVPLGVIGIVYEARPNVTADAAGLCLKSGNAVLLRGGSEAIRSNQAIFSLLAEAAYHSGIPEGSLQFVETTDRKAVDIMEVEDEMRRASKPAEGIKVGDMIRGAIYNYTDSGAFLFSDQRHIVFIDNKEMA